MQNTQHAATMDSTMDSVVSQRSIESAPSDTASEEGRFPRRIRDQFKSEECFICTEVDPNIVTLCCGQAVHCDCLTKWLQTPNQTKCPYCRAILRPSVSFQQEPYQPEFSVVWEPASSDVQFDDSDGVNSSDSQSVSELSEINDTITARGAGFAAVNGSYVRTNNFEDSMRFEKEGIWSNCPHKFAIYACNVSDSTKRWFISIVPHGRNPGTTADVDFYHAPLTRASTTIPPTTGWITDREGLDPPPTLEFLSTAAANASVESMVDAMRRIEAAIPRRANNLDSVLGFILHPSQDGIQDD
jgi:hypothetical protein